MSEKSFDGGSDDSGFGFRSCVELQLEVADLQAFRGDVLAGCDIQRGNLLYRQVLVVAGSGKTQDQLEIVALRVEIANLKEMLITWISQTRLLDKDE